MKHLKFESFISHDSEISVEHPLLDFSKKLEDVIADNKFINDTKYVKNSDFIIKRFDDKENIFIYIYFKHSKLFSIRLNVKGKEVIIRITTYNNWHHIDTSVIEDILNVIKDSSILVDKDFNKYYIPVNKIYDLIKNIEIYKLSTKYNL